VKLFTLERSSFVRQTMLYLLLTLVSGLAACSANRALLSSAGSVNDPTAVIVPLGAFKNPVVPTTQTHVDTEPLQAGRLIVSPPRRQVMATIYVSPATLAAFKTAGADYAMTLQVWEQFLRKYSLPYRVIRTAEELEKLQGGTLVLPCAVALSPRERNAIAAYRLRGGDIFSTWLTGVRDDGGTWLGFEFMRRVLDVEVAGDTQSNQDDTFLMPSGGSPVSHHLSAGMRVWLERVKGWYPVRLRGSHGAAYMQDWSRTVTAENTDPVIAFGERPQQGGSRSVVLGFPERLWLSADPQLLESIVHNALLWTLHQPDVYVAPWPHPYRSATVLVVEGVDNFGAIDAEFAKRMESLGRRSTYLISTAELAKSLKLLKEFAQQGHEIAFLGDTFEGFRNQSKEQQAKRLNAMRASVKAANLPVSSDAGFRAPMDAYDKTTEKLLREQGFGYQIAFMDATDTCLPVTPAAVGKAATQGSGFVVMPRTLPGPEEAAEVDPEEGIAGFVRALKLTQQMGCLAIVAVPNQSLLTPDQLDELLADWDTPQSASWSATAAAVAQWWREHSRVHAEWVPGQLQSQLQVAVLGDSPLSMEHAVWVNLPERGANVELVDSNGLRPPVRIVQVDEWRAALLLKGIPPGQYLWRMRFVPGASDGH